MIKVLLSIPNKSWIHKLVVHAAFGMCSDRRWQVTMITPTWVPYEHNMNRIAKDFLEQGYDYWLNMDADNPPLRNPLVQIDCGYDIVGFPTPVWRDDAEGRPYYWNSMNQQDDGWMPADINRDGMTEVDATGSGCILFNRAVVAAIRNEYGPPFVRTYNDDGIVIAGPDYNFCKRAKALGFRIAVDPTCPCRHFNEIDLFEMTQRFEVVDA